jgi:hypothetical protein
MHDMKRPPPMDTPATYRIAVQGQLDARWSDCFEGMTMTCERGRTGEPVTVLTGGVIDQAALHGLLRTLYGLGLPLLSVACIEPDTEPDTENEDHTECSLHGPRG